MPAVSAAEWLSSEQAIAHIRSCIWCKDGALSRRLPLSMVARAQLQEALGEGSVRAQGRLRFPDGMPPEVMLWPVVAIPSTFWPDSVWDGRSGFRNRSSQQLLPSFEVFNKELYNRWPEDDRVSMPAPFDIDWPRLPDVVAAMTQRLDVSRPAALRRLIEGWEEGKIKLSKGLGSHGSYIFGEWEREDPNALRRGNAQWDDENAATGTQGGHERIVLYGDHLIAVEPRLVLGCEFPRKPEPDRTGAKAPEICAVASDHEPNRQSDRFPGRPSVKSQIIHKFRQRTAAGELADSLGGEARWLYHWAHRELATESGLPSSVRTVENHIRRDYRGAKSKSLPPTK